MAKTLKIIFYVLGGVSLLICLTFGVGMSFFPSFRQATYDFLKVVPEEEHNESITDYERLYRSLLNAEEEKSNQLPNFKLQMRKCKT